MDEANLKSGSWVDRDRLCRPGASIGSGRAFPAPRPGAVGPRVPHEGRASEADRGLPGRSHRPAARGESRSTFRTRVGHGEPFDSARCRAPPSWPTATSAPSRRAPSRVTARPPAAEYGHALSALRLRAPAPPALRSPARRHRRGPAHARRNARADLIRHLFAALLGRVDMASLEGAVTTVCQRRLRGPRPGPRPRPPRRPVRGPGPARRTGAQEGLAPYKRP